MFIRHRQKMTPRLGYVVASLLFWVLFIGQPCTQALAHPSVDGSHTHHTATPDSGHKHAKASEDQAAASDCQCLHDACCDDARVWHDGMELVKTVEQDAGKLFPLWAILLVISLFIVKLSTHKFRIRNTTPHASPPAFKYFCSFLN